MFAVAVHEGAADMRKLLAQMQQARQSLLQASRTGALSVGKANPGVRAMPESTASQNASAQGPSLSQLAQTVKSIWHGWK